jgi:hypothetical protein
MVYGCQSVTIPTSTGTTYEASDISLSPEIKRFVRESGRGIPNGKIVIQGETTGTMTLMYAGLAASVSVPLAPSIGQAFIITTEPNLTAPIVLNCHVEKVGRTYTMGNQAFIPITFSVDLTSSVVVSTAT